MLRVCLVLGVTVTETAPHLSSCGADQVEPRGSAAEEQEEPEHTPDCCSAHSLSAYLA